MTLLHEKNYGRDVKLAQMCSEIRYLRQRPLHRKKAAIDQSQSSIPQRHPKINI